MSALRQAATGPPQVASQIWTNHFSRFWEIIMHAITETAPVDAGTTRFTPSPTNAHRAILSLDLGTTTGWALRANGSHDGGLVSVALGGDVSLDRAHGNALIGDRCELAPGGQRR